MLGCIYADHGPAETRNERPRHNAAQSTEVRLSLDEQELNALNIPVGTASPSSSLFACKDCAAAGSTSDRLPESASRSC